MKCITIVDDLSPYQGISVTEDGSIGVKGGFCTLGDDSDYPAPPDIKSGLSTLNHIKRIHIPQNGFHGVILESDVIAKPLTRDFPILITPSNNRNSNHALVYWAVNLERAKVMVEGVYFGLGNVVTLAVNVLNFPYYETLFSMSPNTLAYLFFSDKTRIPLEWDGQGKLSLGQREEGRQ